jgi:tRNA-dihydrouridine synthase C
VLQGHLEDKFVVGRIKQWLNYLRRGFTEAEAAWPQARKIREVAALFACLEAAALKQQAA